MLSKVPRCPPDIAPLLPPFIIVVTVDHMPKRFMLFSLYLYGGEFLGVEMRFIRLGFNKKVLYEDVDAFCILREDEYEGVV